MLQHQSAPFRRPLAILRNNLFDRLASLLPLLGIFLVGSLSVHAASHAENARALFAQGQHALVNHRYQTALDIFRALLANGVRSAPVYSNLGVAYQRLEMQKEAIASFQKAKELDPSLSGIDLNLGLAFYKHHDFEEAVKQFTAVLAAEPQNTQARYLRGVSYYMLNQYKSAVNELLSVENSQRSNLEYFFVMGVSLGQLKRTEDSKQAFSRMLELGGHTPQLHVLLAQAYLALNDDRNALEQTNRAISIDPQFPFAHYYHGLIYERAGQKAVALEDFEQETKLSQGEPWAYEHIGNLLISENKTPEAISILRDGVANNPDVSKLLVALSKAYLQASRPAEALPLIQKALAIEPRNGSFHYQLSRTYSLLGKRLKAREEMQLAARLIKNYDRQQVRDFSEAEALKQPAYASTASR